MIHFVRFRSVFFPIYMHIMAVSLFFILNVDAFTFDFILMILRQN
jgi:hypothetical protein